MFRMAMEDDPHATRRAQILTESLEKTNEPGWGYFGVPGSLAIGDNSYAPRLVRKPKEEDDAPPPFGKFAPLKKGASTDVYFRFELPLCIDDPYKEREVMTKIGKVWMIDPDAKFKPAGKVPIRVNKLYPYEYVEHCDTVKDPKEVKEKYGGDYRGPPNILCSRSKKGGGGVYTKGVLFGFDEERNALPEHMADDYDAARKMRKQDLEEHKSKLQEMSFKAMDYGNKAFSNNTETFCYDQPTHVPREPMPDKTVKYPHESAFRPPNPMKRGIQKGLIGGIPEYIEDPGPGPTTRKPKDEDAPPPFRNGAARNVCNPMPSVTTNMRNMRNERPSSFARPTL